MFKLNIVSVKDTGHSVWQITFGTPCGRFPDTVYIHIPSLLAGLL
jgi:hypothetical protein